MGGRKKVWKLIGRRDERWSKGGAAAVTARIAFVMDCQDDGKGSPLRPESKAWKEREKKGFGLNQVLSWPGSLCRERWPGSCSAAQVPSARPLDSDKLVVGQSR